jgi:lysophospholipid acyltransferase (LPLAT)-like uncharacterized protein
LSVRHDSLLESIKLILIPPLAAFWIRLTRATMRIRWENLKMLEDRTRSGKPCILAFWHGRMFLMPYGYRGKRVTVLISEHRDGEYISRTMKRFGFATARGSSTRGGAMALREIIRALKQGQDAAFTPDGPRGPREAVQMGVIAAARLSGAPIVPVAFGCSKKKFLKPGIDSWFLFLSFAECSCTARRSRYRETPLRPNRRKRGSIWKLSFAE